MEAQTNEAPALGWLSHLFSLSLKELPWLTEEVPTTFPWGLSGFLVQ